MDGYRKLAIYEKLFKYLVCFMVIIMVIIPLYKSYEHNLAAKKFVISEEEVVNLGMLYPKYKAVTNDGKLFKINAKKSLNQNEDRIVFYKIHGDIDDKNYKKVSFLANQGVYDRVASSIDFTVGVNFSSKDNFQLQSDKAVYSLKTDLISGSDNIVFDNYMGHFVAEEYDIDLQKKQYVFLKDIDFKANDIRNTHIKSQKIIVYDFASNMEVEDDVRYKDDSVVLTSDRFTVFYTKNNSGRILIKKVIAYDDVRIVHEDSVITGDKAIFYPNQDKAEIIQNVVLIKNDNIIKGEKIIYDFNKESFRVLKGKKNKVNLQLKYE